MSTILLGPQKNQTIRTLKENHDLTLNHWLPCSHPHRHLYIICAKSSLIMNSYPTITFNYIQPRKVLALLVWISLNPCLHNQSSSMLNNQAYGNQLKEVFQIYWHQLVKLCLLPLATDCSTCPSQLEIPSKHLKHYFTNERDMVRHVVFHQ